MDDELELEDELEESDDDTIEYVEGKKYSKWELEQLADQFLRDDTRRELCRKCGEYGSETGHVESQPQYDKEEKPLVDDEGGQLYVDFPELACENGHRWYKGEGKARGNKGKNPILFEDHIRNRQRREIYNHIGVPDPSIVSGIYNRVHKDGRKVNSKEQRAKHGAAFYR